MDNVTCVTENGLVLSHSLRFSAWLCRVATGQWQKIQPKTINLGGCFPAFFHSFFQNRWWFSSLSSLNPDRQTNIGFGNARRTKEWGLRWKRKIDVPDNATTFLPNLNPFPWILSLQSKTIKKAQRLLYQTVPPRPFLFPFPMNI